MRLPRLTLGRVMVAIAIASIPMMIWSIKLHSRRQGSLNNAAYHERREGEERRNLARFSEARRRGTRIDPSALDSERTSRLRAEYHAFRRRNYLRVAGHPWESVGSDPGEPGGNPVSESMYYPPVEFPEFTPEMMSKLRLP